MIRVPTIISALTAIVCVICIVLLLYLDQFCDLKLIQKIEISFWFATTWIAITSLSFVIWSYWQTNHAFIESQRPQLLIQMVCQYLSNASNEVDSYTVIHYKNLTSNQFPDLRINMEACIEGKTIELPDIFPSKMVMPGKDSRIRRFKTYQELRNYGVDLVELENMQKILEINISYSYSFGGRLELIRSQSYRWDFEAKGWQII